MKTRAFHDTSNDTRIEPAFAPVGLAHGESVAPSQCSPATCGESSSPPLDRLAHYLIQPVQRLVPIVFAVTVLAALFIGWNNRDEGHLTPETGTGYWLGIIGGSMMLLLLLYPLRKRVRLLRHLGKVPGWFRVHMVLGVVGPTLILFHSNFKLGSLNSNVALGAMLIVVASGVVGRYLYAKVHKGLYGSKAEVGEIVGDARVLKVALGDDLTGAENLVELLREFESKALAPRRGVLASIGAFLSSGIRARRVRSALLRESADIVSERAGRHRWSRREKRRRLKLIKHEIALYFAAVNKASRFVGYERLFALWHVLHFPLFLLLVITAIIHVVAVHLY